MKQFACFLLSFALLFSACSKDEDVADPDEGQKEPVEDVTEDSTQNVVEEKVVPFNGGAKQAGNYDLAHFFFGRNVFLL